MKNKLIPAGILLVALLLFLLRQKPEEESGKERKANADRNVSGPAGQLLPKKGTSTGRPGPAGPRSIAPGPSPAKTLQALKDAEAPISFFGKVVDEEGSGLPGASIAWSIVRSGSYMPKSGFPASSTGTATSADDGSFRITNERGVSLSIDQLSKAGYHEPKFIVRAFGYGNHPSPHQPDEGKPVAYLLVKDGTSSVVRSEVKLELLWDGTPVQVDLPGADGRTLTLTSKRDGEAEQQGHFTWSLDVRSPGGSVRSAEGITVPLAPQDGYGENFSIGSEANERHWQSGKAAAMFFKTAKGHFGRAYFDVKADVPSGGRMGWVMLYVNTSGGRLVE